MNWQNQSRMARFAENNCTLGKGWDKTRLAGDARRKACSSGAREASVFQSQGLEGKVTVIILLTVLMINSLTVYFQHRSTVCQQTECGLQLMLQQTSVNILLASDSMWQLYQFGSHWVWHGKTDSFTVLLSAGEWPLHESKSSQLPPTGSPHTQRDL